MTTPDRFDHPLRRALFGIGASAVMAAMALPAAQASDVRHWTRAPIDIKLPVGSERIVVFDRPVRVGLPSKIADPAVLRVQSTGGAVYLKANQPFATQRVQIQEVTSGRVMLFDLSGVAHASHETVQVVTDAEPSGDSARAPATAPQRDSAPPAAFGRGADRGGAPLPVQLVRHAAQALYSPERVLTATRGIQRIATPDRSLPGLLPAYPVSARPIAAWRAAAYTVTAIEITNRDPRRSFELDPRGLAGDFYAAGFMHRTIGPAGTLADTTTLFAVTENGALADALAPPVGAGAAEADDAH